jgi:hypothetical protein
MTNLTAERIIELANFSEKEFWMLSVKIQKIRESGIELPTYSDVTHITVLEKLVIADISNKLASAFGSKGFASEDYKIWYKNFLTNKAELFPKTN